MQQIFVEKELKLDEKYYFDELKAHHLMHVLRIKPNTIVRLVHDMAYLATIGFEDNKIYAKVIKEDDNKNELGHKVILVQALVKKEKWELILQKAAELGASEVIPLITSRVIIDPKRFEEKRNRYEKILLEASQQCKRNKVCELNKVHSIDDLVFEDCNKFVAYESQTYPASKLTSVMSENQTVIVVGPEGGFSDKEIAKLSEKGFQCVTLGNRILRAETASMYALSVIGEYLS